MSFGSVGWRLLDKHGETSLAGNRHQAFGIVCMWPGLCARRRDRVHSVLRNIQLRLRR